MLILCGHVRFNLVEPLLIRQFKIYVSLIEAPFLVSFPLQLTFMRRALIYVSNGFSIRHTSSLWSTWLQDVRYWGNWFIDNSI